MVEYSFKEGIALDHPVVSVIIPAYNAEAHIEKCLLSLRKQTFQDFEIIVVDDGSQDNTLLIAKNYARTLQTGYRSGAGHARNLGAREAKGDILIFTDSDVIVPPGWIERILTVMGRYNVKCVGGGYAGSVGKSFIEEFAASELLYRRRDLRGFVKTSVSNNFACYKKVFFEAGGFPEHFRAASLEDMVFSFRISQQYQIFWDKENGVYHHFKPNLGGYLKQQYVFGRDTVYTFFEYPRLLFTKTHQGRSLHIEIILMFATLATFFFKPWLSLIGIALVCLINIPLINFVRHRLKEPIITPFSVILLRNTVCAFSVLVGTLMGFRRLFEIYVKGAFTGQLWKLSQLPTKRQY